MKVHLPRSETQKRAQQGLQASRNPLVGRGPSCKEHRVQAFGVWCACEFDFSKYQIGREDFQEYWIGQEQVQVRHQHGRGV